MNKKTRAKLQGVGHPAFIGEGPNIG